MVITKQNTNNPREYNDWISCKIDKNLENSENNDESSKFHFNNKLEIKIYQRRWLQLALFVSYSTLNNLQCFQYTIITNIICRYYDISPFTVSWTSMIIMLTYIMLIFPASYLLGRFGLRSLVIVGGTATCLGAWIKYFSASPDNFAGVFVGQTLVAVSQVVVLSSPGRLAAHWFGPDQIATATSIACFGIQLGISSCYLITTMVVKNREEIEDIGKDLSTYLLAIAIVCTIVIFALILLFKNEPPLPPSSNRAMQKAHSEVNSESFWAPIKRIISNRNFLLLWNAYGIHLCVLGTLSTLMNPLYLAHFENGEEDVGRMGVGAVLLGGFGSALAARILDRTKKFRVIIVAICLICLIAELVFAWSLMMEVKWMVFTSGAISGTALVSYSTIGFEMCVELTYPEVEGTSIGILNISNQLYGALLLLISGKLMEIYGDMAGHGCMIFVLALGTILNAINRGELLRQKAVKASGYNGVSLQVLEPVETTELKKESSIVKN